MDNFYRAGIVLLLGLLVLLSCSKKEEKKVEGGNLPKPAAEAPIPVRAERAFVGTLVLNVSATGTARAPREVAVVPKVGGQIVELPVKEGDFVGKGELLVKLDDREYRLAVADAQDQLLQAELEFGLLMKGSVGDTLPDSSRSAGGNAFLPDSLPYWSLLSPKPPILSGQTDRTISDDSTFLSVLARDIADILSGKRRREVMAQKSGLAKAVLALRRAQLNLSYTEIRAPFSGYVGDLAVKEGQQISPGQICLKLVDLSNIEVYLQVLESEIGLVKVGRKAHIRFSAYPDETFEGKVVAINPLIDPESKTATVIVRLPNPQKKILPGMFASAKLEAQIFSDRLLVPKEAILVRDQRKLVFVVREGRAKWCYVKTGRENDKYVEILDSAFHLKPGEWVITEGHYTLVHDARVRIIGAPQ